MIEPDYPEPSPEQALLLSRVRRMMLIAGATTGLAIAAILVAIGYRLYTSEGSGAIKEVTATGKGLRPLAEMVLRQIRDALPTAALIASGDRVGIADPVEFAALWVSPRELRLGLCLGDAPFEGLLVKARIPGADARLSHMVVLTDARQLGPPLMQLVKRAQASAKSSAPGAV